MSSPISFLVDHEAAILAAYNENNGKPANTWRRLETELPELSQTMTFNTFKQYVSVFAFVKKRLDEVRQVETNHALRGLRDEKSALEKKLQHASERLYKVIQNQSETAEELKKTLKDKIRLESLLNEGCAGLDKVRQDADLQSSEPEKLDKVRQFRKLESPVIQKSGGVPKRISGWSVQRSKDGYYRCYRKINKRLHSVYLGKEIDLKDAERRIKAKEKALKASSEG